MPTADWLLRLSERLTAAPGHAVGGHTVNRLPRNTYSTASQMLIDYLYAYFRRRKGRFFTANNLAMETAMYRTLGGFDTDMPLAAAEDREFCDRWTDHGHPLTEAPEAVVEHAHTLDFRGFCRQHFNYGRGAYYYRRIVANRGKQSLRIEPLHFYSNLLLYPSTRESGLRWLQLSLLLVIAQAANASGFFFEKLRPCHVPDLRLAQALRPSSIATGLLENS
jgi:GT2 family glycosyltransferase